MVLYFCDKASQVRFSRPMVDEEQAARIDISVS